MSERKINLEEIIEECWSNRKNSKYGNITKDSMYEFGKQLLELAAENVSMTGYSITEKEGLENLFNICKDDMSELYYYVDKESILDTIKQVE